MSLDATLRILRRGSPIQIGLRWNLTVQEADLPIDGLPAMLDGFRIVHLSDTHFRPAWSPSYDEALQVIADLKADLVAFTGDWIEDKLDHRDGVETVMRFARGLRSRLGTFSCIGNHDGDLLAPHLLDADVHTLVGESRRIAGSDAAIEIIGLPGVYRTDLSDALLDSFGPPGESTFRLVLGHYPDQIRRIGTLAPHLMLTGHTHGGQICLPGQLPIIRHDSLPRHQVVGLHRMGPTWLHVSRGLGCSMWNLRIFCPPEITALTLRRR